MAPPMSDLGLSAPIAAKEISVGTTFALPLSHTTDNLYTSQTESANESLESTTTKDQNHGPAKESLSGKSGKYTEEVDTKVKVASHDPPFSLTAVASHVSKLIAILSLDLSSPVHSLVVQVGYCTATKVLQL